MMLYAGLLVALVPSPGSTMTDAELQAMIDGFDARRDEMLRRQLANPYPEGGVWHYADFALAALYLNERVDEGNEAILTIRREFPVDPDPRPGPEEPEVDDFHWSINLLQRIYFLFNANSSFFPGRLTPEAEAALLAIFWDSGRRHCRIEYADPERTWWIWGSENHGAMRSSGFWGTAHILKDSPDYRDRRYEDGSTPAEMAAAWDAFYRRFARQRAGKGLLVEIASTYNKYTLQGWYNMADFASDPVLKQRIKMLLDLFWADWAIEQIDGVRGGGKHRIYPGGTSTSGARFSGTGMASYYFGLGGARSQHPGHMCAATSTYRPPLCVMDMALDVEGRGTYEYVSRRMGLNLLPKPDEADWETYVMRPDYGGILRYTYCTPDFIMGTSMVEARPHEQWAAISSQNRWDGVVFGGARDACLFAQPLKPERGSVYNSHWTVQRKGIMILQKLLTHRHAHGQRIWFAEALERSEEGGWVFAEAPRAYAACRVVSGGTHWEEAVPEDGAVGTWLACEDEFTPIIFEVARKSDFPDLAAFKSAIGSSPLSVEDGVLRYRSSFYGDELTFHADSAEPPRVNGKPVDFRPSNTYDSPFIQSEWGSGIVTLQKDGRRVVLNFNDE
jgi:hypothetical protein